MVFLKILIIGSNVTYHRVNDRTEFQGEHQGVTMKGYNQYFCWWLQVEVAEIELVVATDPGEHNSNSDDALDSTSTSCSIDDTNSQSNVSIKSLH